MTAAAAPPPAFPSPPPLESAAPSSAADAFAAPGAAADRLATEALLRCWIREHRIAAPPDRTLRLDVGGAVLAVPVEYWSATGMHRLGTPTASPSPRTTGGPLSPGGLAQLMGEGAGARGGALEELVGRVVESAGRIAAHLADRAARPAPEPRATPFLIAEQGLIAGHPLHPTPKSRDGLDPASAARYSPELRGSFPLHWFAADPRLAVHDSELGPSAPDLAVFLSGLTPDGRALIPAHPWQAEELLRRPPVVDLIASGRLAYLGPAGADWYPTSSLRTVYRPDVPVMLKLSLALNITNSRRENLRKELLRGIEAHRLLCGELGARLLTAHPGFRVLTDAAFLAADGVPGLDVSFRHSPFRPSDFVYCVAALTDLGRGAAVGDGRPHELAAHVHAIAAAEGRSPAAVADEWFARYVSILITPLLWLDAEYGVTLEAHQQNSLVQLDQRGYPGAGWYRDNQGFYYRESRIAELEELGGLPGLGRASDTVVPDRVVTERLLYYVGINNLMGVAGAFGCAGLSDERRLLGLAADLLAPLRGHPPVDLLLGARALRCKANLRTRAAGLDELAGELATQSVYVEVANPFSALAGAGAAGPAGAGPR